MKRIYYWIMGLFAGGVIGAAAGLLLAPASGKEIRERINGYSRQVVSEIRSAADLKRQELEAELAKLKSGNSQS